MLFNSWEFLVLLGVTLVLYYLMPLLSKRVALGQVGLLLVSSGTFYAWEDPRLIILLLLSCGLNVWGAAAIISYRQSGQEALAKRSLNWTVWANLLLLAWFKYAGLIFGVLPSTVVTPELVKWIKSIPLPVGISFYTFQGISLVVDVWRRELDPPDPSARIMHGSSFAKKFGALSFYVAFFPQLVAGPIVKARDFIGQIGAKQLNHVLWSESIRYLIAGYFLKMYVADNLAENTISITREWVAHLGSWDLLALLYAYGFQIFADFAGYSLIAIGLGNLFGYALPENFRYPYLSCSVTEFWRRWHLSLSSWLRDYLYIPLGGNRKGVGRTYLNLFLVMLLGGLWHGADWKFAVWGTAHGTLLMVERFFSGPPQKNAPPAPAWKQLLGWFYTFNAVMLLWLTFCMPSWNQLALYISRVFEAWHEPVKLKNLYVLGVFATAPILYHAYGWLKENRPNTLKHLRGSWIEGFALALMLYLVITNAGAPQGFIYFQF